ncbi:hypothetical protein Nepgr_006125 [Nepenthes gracilis]|uniref:Ribosomal RNA-processing protein 7 C-terminal domain-containing protein n=1 Tax=Nepenthes gracilis TaxID=150966 RepID=A0AAD3S4M1_NEPGR|nr:hypothetical protein Nepgr_006125 [Nepenthes gracilis]
MELEKKEKKKIKSRNRQLIERAKKKACKNKRVRHSSNKEDSLMHEEEFEPDKTYQISSAKSGFSGKLKRKYRKACKKRDYISSNEGSKSIVKEGEDELDKAYQISSGDNECSRGIKNNTRKAYRSKKKKKPSSNEEKKSLHEKEVEPECQVHQISSGEEDFSCGMRKWVKEHHDNRPGLKVLQQRIDDFITAYEAEAEQARKEREAQAAEGGWTVVVHRKGGKKTTDPESGVAVGSVAQAAVVDKMAKRKRKDVGLDFYRFQRREAQRNELMKLQSKFEEDRKRIQELRAARKFRPY